MSLAHRHVYTAAHTHSYTGGRGRGREDKHEGKEKRKGGGEKGEEIITYKDQGKAEGCEGPPSGNVRDTLKL